MIKPGVTTLNSLAKPRQYGFKGFSPASEARFNSGWHCTSHPLQVQLFIIDIIDILGSEDMQAVKEFRLTLVKQDKHLRLPTVTSIIVVQNLYDILFQYLIDPDQESRLKQLIALMELHIKSKSRAPFSIPMEELEFLGEGLEELKLLNWAEVAVTVFRVEVPGEDEPAEEDLEPIFDLLEELLTFKRVGDSDLIYVYPSRLTMY
jgi:hypothetical protein